MVSRQRKQSLTHLHTFGDDRVAWLGNRVSIAVACLNQTTWARAQVRIVGRSSYGSECRPISSHWREITVPLKVVLKIPVSQKKVRWGFRDFSIRSPIDVETQTGFHPYT
jgi:hypothetical protein